MPPLAPQHACGRGDRIRSSPYSSIRQVSESAELIPILATAVLGLDSIPDGYIATDVLRDSPDRIAASAFASENYRDLQPDEGSVKEHIERAKRCVDHHRHRKAPVLRTVRLDCASPFPCQYTSGSR